jgi:hypothetical protein
MGRSSQGYAALGVWICYVFLDLHQWVLERVLLFESLLEEVEEFLGVVLLRGHRSESQAGSGSPAPLTVSSPKMK